MEEVDTELELKIKETKKLIAKMACYKLQSTYTLEEKIHDVSSVQAWLRHLNRQRDCLKNLLIKERKKMDLLQQLVDKIRYADNNYQRKSIKECLSAQEMNNQLSDDQLYHVYMGEVECTNKLLIQRQKLQCRIGHGSKSLRKEKQLLKDMKPSQQEAESVSISKDETWNLLESKVALQEQIKVAGENIDELRKTEMALSLGDIIRQVERESEAMERGIVSGRKKFPVVNQREYTICSLRSKPRDLQSCSTRLATRYCRLGLSQLAINVSSDVS